jgi:hypothetical protein
LNQFVVAVRRLAKTILQSGTLKGILWHQGESNTIDADTPADAWNKERYEADFTRLVTAFREELKAPDVPFIAGELGRWYPKGKGVEELDVLLRSLETKLPRFGFVISEELMKMDMWHFDTPSQRLLGHRYADVYLEISRPGKTVT